MNTLGVLGTGPAMSRPDLLAEPVAKALAALGAAADAVAVAEIDPTLADTAAFCERYGVSLEESANCVVISGRREGEVRYAACVVLATTRLDVNKTVRRRLGVKKASFADPEQTRSITGMRIGGVTALGLPEGLPIWVDARVVERPRIILGGGSRNCKVVGPPTLLTAQSSIEVVAGLAVSTAT